MEKADTAMSAYSLLNAESFPRRPTFDFMVIIAYLVSTCQVTFQKSQGYLRK